MGVEKNVVVIKLAGYTIRENRLISKEVKNFGADIIWSRTF